MSEPGRRYGDIVACSTPPSFCPHNQFLEGFGKILRRKYLFKLLVKRILPKSIAGQQEAVML